jgi:hypothetical protein
MLVISYKLSTGTSLLLRAFYFKLNVPYFPVDSQILQDSPSAKLSPSISMLFANIDGKLTQSVFALKDLAWSLMPSILQVDTSNVTTLSISFILSASPHASCSKHSGGRVNEQRSVHR